MWKKLAFGLLIVMMVALACATIIERECGTATARDMVYHSMPFVLLWSGIAVSGAVVLWQYRVWHRLPVLMVHVALLLILCGAGISRFTATEGKMQLREGERGDCYVDERGTVHSLPFAVTLGAFRIEHYAGTQLSMDFVSSLMLTEGADTTMVQVSMNHIAAHRGYRLYQMGYDASGHGTVLQVSHDPWGIAVTYCGYALLGLSMLALLVWRRGKWRALWHHEALRGGAVVVLLMSLLPIQAGETAPRVLPAPTAGAFATLRIMHNNRVCPFNTFAREFTAKLYGNPHYAGFTPEQVVTGWMFYYDDWAAQPMIKVKSAEVREQLSLVGKYASLDDCYDRTGGYRLQPLLNDAMLGGNATDLRGVMEMQEKLQLIQSLAAGRALRVFPLVDSVGRGSWYAPVADDLPGDIDTDRWIFMRQGLNYLNELVARGDWEGTKQFVEKLEKYQQKECGDNLPTTIAAELTYNRLTDVCRVAAMLLATLGLVAFMLVARAVGRGLNVSSLLRHGVMVVAVAATLLLTITIALRWRVSGHVPLSNGHETMQFMAWVTLVFTLCLTRRSSLLPPMGLLTAGLSLLVSTMGQSNPSITPLMPVLHSPLMSIHVAVIMLAYSLLALLMLCGAMALLLRRHEAAVVRLHVVGQLLLLPAVALLGAGIFIGAVWANVSWGSYWTWDPKEVWALITLLVYSLPLHDKSLRPFSRPRFFHAYMVVAFLSVLITYFGVNFVLGGMHSYA